jgi:hypothetical protein
MKFHRCVSCTVQDIYARQINVTYLFYWSVRFIPAIIMWALYVPMYWDWRYDNTTNSVLTVCRPTLSFLVDKMRGERERKSKVGWAIQFLSVQQEKAAQTESEINKLTILYLGSYLYLLWFVLHKTKYTHLKFPNFTQWVKAAGPQVPL